MRNRLSSFGSAKRRASCQNRPVDDWKTSVAELHGEPLVGQEAFVDSRQRGNRWQGPVKEGQKKEGQVKEGQEKEGQAKEGKAN